MKIRDLNAFIKRYSEVNAIDWRLTSRGDQFAQNLFGKGIYTGFNNYLLDLTNFASLPAFQVFFELIQNADDAKASDFFIFWDENDLIAVNNGKPFHTDPNEQEKGQLRAFLSKGLGDKNPEQIGKHGIGSKLLYHLLIDVNIARETRSSGERIQEKVMRDLKGMVLYSWANWAQIEDFVNLGQNSTFTYGDPLDVSTPLLTKIALTYYPALPHEIASIEGVDEKVSLFPGKELDRAVSSFKRLFPSEYYAALDKGTLIWLPLGGGQHEEIRKVYEFIEAGVSASMAFLRNIDRVVLNGEVIHKSSFNLIEFPFLENKELKIAFLESSEERTEEPLINFFEYFPFLEEVHGLNYIIHTNAFNHKPDRQQIDFSKDENTNVLDEIADVIINHLEELVEEGHFDRYNQLFNSILTSKDISSKQQVRLFHVRLLDALRARIPTTKGYIPLKVNEKGNSNILIKDFLFPLTPSDIGLEDNESAWVIEDLRPLFQILHENKHFKITKFSISACFSNLMKHAPFVEWLFGLAPDRYQELIRELCQEVMTPDKFRAIPFLKGQNKTLYALAELQQNADFIFLPSSLRLEAGTILANRDFPWVGIDLPLKVEKLDAFDSWAKQNLSWLDRFNRLSADVDWTRDEKRLLFKGLRGLFNDTELREKLLLFSNKTGVKLALCRLLEFPDKIAPSGLLEYYQIKPSEPSGLEDWSSLYMQPGEIWKNAITDWNAHLKEAYITIAPDLSKVKTLYEDFSRIFELNPGNAKIKSDSDLAIFYSSKGEFVSWKDIYWNEAIQGLSEEEYGKVCELVGNIADCSLLYVKSRTAATRLPFSWHDKGLNYLEERLENEFFEVTPDAVPTLIKLKATNDGSLYTYMKFFEEDGAIFARFNSQAKIIQFDSQYSSILEFLDAKDNYYFLPSALKPILSDQAGLFSDGPAFLVHLVNTFGACEAFVDLAFGLDARIPENLKAKQAFFMALKRIDFYSDGRTHYGRDSLEYKLIKIGLDSHLINRVKEITYIDGKSLDQITVQDDVSITYRGIQKLFLLSELFPNEYSDLGVITRLRLQFGSAWWDISSIFNLEPWKLSDVAEKIYSIGHFENLYQFQFLVIYELTEDENSIDLDYSNLDEAEMLEWLYATAITVFPKVFEFEGWELQKTIICNDETLLLPVEKIPDYAQEWLSGERQSGTKFLYESGVKDENQPPVVEVRIAIREDRYLKEGVKIEGLTKSPFWGRNTLEWVAGTRAKVNTGSKAYRHIVDFLKEDHSNDRFHYGLILQDQHGLLELQVLRNNENYYYFTSQLNLDKLLSQALEKGYKLVDGTQFAKTVLRKFQVQGIDEAKVLKKCEVDEGAEWREAFYKKWKEDPEVIHRIYHSKEDFQLQFSAMFGEEETDFWHDTTFLDVVEEEEFKRIFINESKFEKSIIGILGEKKEEFFKTKKEKDQLISLLNMAMEELNKRPVGKPDTGLGPGDGVGSGNGDGSGKEPGVDEIPEAPHEVVGYLGERLAYYWLKEKYPDWDVNHVGEFTREYDISIDTGNGIYEIEVKSTKNPVREKDRSVAFFIRPSQLEHLEENEKKNYFIFRISLWDIGMPEKSYPFDELDKDVKVYLDELARDFLMEPNGFDLIDRTIMLFQLGKGLLKTLLEEENQP